MSTPELIGRCGIVCSECPAYLATKNSDEVLRSKTAEEWSKHYNVSLKPEDINCVGCIVSDGRHIGHWSECDICQCARARQVKNCGRCSDYACDKIAAFFAMVPTAKAVLDRESQNN